ncbi:transcription termination factor NusA [bacterium]
MEQNIGGDLFPVLEQIERDKGIKKEDLLVMIEQALISAFKKHHSKVNNVEAHINPETGEIEFYIQKKVVDFVEDDLLEVSLENALKSKKKASIGDELKVKIDTSNFGRIAAQTAKQVIIQKIRETEKENLYKEFKEKEGFVINGQVSKIINNTAIVDLGKVEAVLPLREQIRTEEPFQGMYLKLYVLKVELTPRGPKVILSRSHPELLRRLFEKEIPEVYDGTIEIKAISREPGIKAKVAVCSKNPKVDPVGACVGVKGGRIKAIVDELDGERIDLILYSVDIKQYIKNALNPADITDIFIDEQSKNVEVIVPDDQLSLAIGKKGYNVKLAARLTGYHLDVKSVSMRKEEKEKKIKNSLQELEKLEGIGRKTASILVTAGYTNLSLLERVNKEDLMGLQGIGEKTAENIIKAVKKYNSKAK